MLYLLFILACMLYALFFTISNYESKSDLFWLFVRAYTRVFLQSICFAIAVACIL